VSAHDRLMSDRRDDVIKAALNLAATTWDNGRETASASMDLDFAHDRLNEVLKAYVAAATGNNPVAVHPGTAVIDGTPLPLTPNTTSEGS
jgi:hypothetical protein